MRFHLRAITNEGRIESLDYQAVDEQAARQQAESRGYTVLQVRGRHGVTLLRSQRFPVQLFSQELLVLISAGLPLVDAIETLAQKEKRDEFRALLGRIVAVLREGQPFSAALEQQPAVFSQLYVATVRAAEKTSDLAPALTRYVAYQAQIEAIRKRALNASIYPMVLIGAGALVSLFLLFYVVPRFGKIYSDRTAEMPFFSQVLIGWGQLVEGHALLALGALAGFAIAIVYMVRDARAKAFLGDLLWRVPAIGERLKVYQLARLYRTTGMLLRGGMPLVAALGMSAELLHPVLRGRLAAASRAISEGRGVSESLDANGLATPVALRMLGVGEQGGNMGEMMERAAGFHDEELSRWVDWFTRMFEPLLMAVIGLVIGAIVVLMYMPIFELAGNLR
ncbi:MAG TPA: type II secretion system F family protein [Burkholderiales bacterium]|nr:type II secretion system F family protein [Burkholderiales bacterium]